MRTIAGNFLVLVAIGLVGVASSCGGAMDGQPFTAPTPAATQPALAVASPSPFPSPENDEMVISSSVWIDARPAPFDTVVRAFSGDTECARVEAGTVAMDSYGTDVFMRIPSAAALPGCGVPGLQMELRVDGRPETQTIVWQREYSMSVLAIVIGPPFGRYLGSFTASRPRNFEVQPEIGGAVCGKQVNPAQGTTEFGFDVVVDPAELVPGCGRSGALVEFRLIFISQDGSRTDAGIIGSAPWSVWVPGGPWIEVPPAVVQDP